MLEIVLKSSADASRRRLVNRVLLGAAFLLPAVAAFFHFGRRHERPKTASGGMEAPEGPGFTIRDDEPWAKPIASDDMKGRNAAIPGSSQGSGPRPPMIPRVKAVDGSTDRTHSIFRANESEGLEHAKAVATQQQASAIRMNPFNRNGSAERPSAEAGAWGGRREGQSAARTPQAAIRAGSGPTATQGPVPRSGPVQSAAPLNHSGLAYAPLGPSGARAGYGVAQQTGGASPGMAAPGGAATAGSGALFAAREAGPEPNGAGSSGSGGSWGEPIRGNSGGQGDGGSGEDPAVKLGTVNTAGTIWGMDLNTLYKKLKEAGVSVEQLRLVESCLAGEAGCTGGDIWQACTKAAIFNTCAAICTKTPGCKVPHGGTTTTTTTTKCEAAPGCLPAGTMLEVTTDADVKIWTKPGGGSCCSCDSSCYKTDDPSPNYGNTGKNCHDSHQTGKYVHRFCSD